MKYLMTIVFICALHSIVESAAFSISDVARLAGCWQGTEDPGIVEQWMLPEGKMTMGMSRTIQNGVAIQFEFLRIIEDAGTVSYVAKPSGQPEASFPLIHSDKNQLVFENPQHDFPQRILYTFSGRDLVTARIEGKNNGKNRGFDIPMKRVACPQ